ncbi:MAG: thioredoxin domain-containing protein [Bacteroidia bacterium]|nr:thioredoxin domain-containing protein [Bacteroidia bacterium]|tara:strand:- start:5932 stop:8019 length:2088 start_codon:yes stop_codon:yes gene_type:complete
MMKNYVLSILSIVSVLSSCGQKNQNKSMSLHTNQLIKETSPYLLQHAHNPVDWHAWNPENLSEAKKLNKPVLISIGYSSCHWCHVMEHESFENEEVAQYMNDHFYCIKVDREERPDVDQIYMTAANIITGRGGWPLNCFTLPTGEPFHAGTYYPSKDWLRLLKNISDQYQSNFDKIKEYAQKLTRGIQLQETAISDQIAQKLDPNVLDEMVNSWENNWDYENGGMKKAPKFPMPSNYDFLISYTHWSEDKSIDEFIDISLTKMAYGGIFDQIGGGFSRYSVDKIWKVPHFEKMLYDNAQLLTIYARAYQKTKNPLFKQVMDKTIQWLEREMRDNSGLFYSALDADSEGEEGKYYVWKSDNIKTILGSNFDLAASYYEIDKKGQWEHQNNILLRDIDDAQIKAEFQLSTKELEEKITHINQKLLERRIQRIPPGLDDKCLTSWNSMMVSGLVDAYKATKNEHYKKLAIQALDTILEIQMEDSNLWHSYKNGQSTIPGMLEDYAFLIKACIDAFSIISNETYINIAKRLTEIAMNKFYDAEKELFYFNETNELIVRTTEVHDNVIPATNSVMANNLLHVGLIYGNSRFIEIAENLVGKVQSNMASYPSGYSNWSKTHLAISKPFYEVVIIGKNAEEVASKFRQTFHPNTLVLFSTSDSDLPMFKNRFKANETLIYVCQKGVCKLPVKTIEEALELIQ